MHTCEAVTAKIVWFGKILRRAHFPRPDSQLYMSTLGFWRAYGMFSLVVSSIDYSIDLPKVAMRPNLVKICSRKVRYWLSEVQTGCAKAKLPY